MKELSIEQKAKRYDEAIKRIEDIKTGKCETTFMFTEGLFEHIFPELKESEDKRIRKELILYLGDMPEDTELRNGVTNRDVLAWIEKQGEQKPKFRVGDTIKCKYDDRQFTIKSVNLDKGTYTYTQEGCGNDIDYADEEFELVEHKPTDKLKPKFRVKYADSEYNVLEVKDIDGVTFYGIEDEPNHIDYVQAENCERVDKIEQKPDTGFSDLRTWKYIVDIVLTEKEGIGQYLDSPFTEEVAKKLQKRFGKSPKVRYTWKPSKEQINGIKCAIKTLRHQLNVGDKRLNSLYQDLKKLKG